MNETNFGWDRRRFLASGVALATTLQLQRAAFAAGLAQGADVCRLSPEAEVGPYYVGGEMVRADIREKKPGVPLSLRIMVMDARTCEPLKDAAVDIWHCDALGVYSGYTKQSLMQGGPGGPGGPPGGFDPEHGGPPPGPPPGGDGGGPPQSKPSDKMTFLRGIQMTGSDGSVEFRTVFPGFYMGRTNHIHFKVRIGGHKGGRSYVEGHTSHIGQIYFPEEMTVELMKHAPYRDHAIHRTTQGEDGIFHEQHGDLSLARVEALFPGSPEKGMHAEMVAAVDPTATPAPVGMGGPGGGRPRG